MKSVNMINDLRQNPEIIPICFNILFSEPQNISFLNIILNII